MQYQKCMTNSSRSRNSTINKCLLLVSINSMRYNNISCSICKSRLSDDSERYRHVLGESGQHLVPQRLVQLQPGVLVNQADVLQRNLNIGPHINILRVLSCQNVRNYLIFNIREYWFNELLMNSST